MATPAPHGSVRARITAAMAPWQDSTDKPPFTAVQLVVMALLTSGISLIPKDVWKWTIVSFSYYQSLASDTSWTVTCHDYDNGNFGTIHAFRREFDAVFLEYNLPLMTSTIRTSEGGDHTIKYTISPWMGQAWLNLPDDTAPIDVTTFPFFELPAELRNAIYTMVFQYPRSGVYIRSFWYGSLGPSQYELLSAGKSSSILLPLLVSRQFHDEAMPIFLNINTFFFNDWSQLSRVTTNWSEARRKHVKSIGFEYERKPRYTADKEELSETLNHLPNLHDSTLWFAKQEWSEEKRLEIWTVREWEDMPCVAPLREVRGLEKVKLIGCPASLRGLLEKEMCQPRSIGYGSK
ncbi:hypothetical protein LTS10_000994 [Elasticomyces elasticus]|nr:hypothetical protein LTS10_000994 [Elasticomyces elasticus]